MSNRKVNGSKRLRTVCFSGELVEREVNRLQRALRRLYFRLKRGQIAWATCVEEGTDAIYIAYRGMLLRLEDFLRSHGLQFDVDAVLFDAVLAAGLLCWSNIVLDTAKIGHSIPQPLLVNGRIVEVFEGQPKLEYWTTHRGLLRRVDLLGQDFEYSLHNEAIKSAATGNVSFLDIEEAGGVYGLKWIREDDDRVCMDCIRSSIGGEDMNGFYLPHEFEQLELPPLHPNCRCRIAIILLSTKK